MVLLYYVGNITSVVAGVLVCAYMQHFEDFQAMVIIALIDYFSMGKVKPMIFMQNVIGYCGFVPEEFTSQDTFLLSFMLDQSSIEVLFPCHFRHAKQEIL